MIKKIYNTLNYIIMMYCNKCKKNLEIKNFSTYKINNKDIYYLTCDNCRNKIDHNIKKEKEMNEYLNRKNNNIIECECGNTYIYFREYHKYRHFLTKKHQNYINKNIL